MIPLVSFLELVEQISLWDFFLNGRRATVPHFEHIQVHCAHHKVDLVDPWNWGRLSRRWSQFVLAVSTGMNNVLMEFSVVCLTFGLLFVLPCVLLSEMENQEEQRVALKFLQKSGSTPIQCWRSLSQVFGTQTMSKTQVRVWCRCFSAGETSVKVKPKTGRPRTQRTEENKDKVDQLVHQDGRRSVRNLADQTGIKKDVVWKIVSKDLNRKKKSAHFVPHLLTQEQKDFRKKLCEENLALIHQDHRELLSKIVTGDET